MTTASLIPQSNLKPEEQFGAFICDDETMIQVSQVIEEKTLPASLIKSGGVEMAIRTLRSVSSPEILVVDLSNSIDPTDDMNALAEVCDAGTMVIAIGAQNDITLYRDLLASGVQDYLVKPLKLDEFREILLTTEHALRFVEEEEQKKVVDESDKVISIIGVRGGVGASTIATSCAWLLANEFKRATALLDMDVYFGTNALTFELEPGRGLCDALENPSRVDGLFIERAMIKESPNLSILGAEASLNDPIFNDPSAVTHLIGELRDNFRYIIMDLPRSAITEHPTLLAQSSEIFLVSDLSLAATRDTIRLLAYCQNIAPNAKVKIILSKTPPPALSEVSKKDFEASIEASVDYEIPMDQKLLVAVAREGKNLPSSAKNSKMVKILSNIAREIIGYEVKIEQEAFWSKLTSKIHTIKDAKKKNKSTTEDPKIKENKNKQKIA